MAELYVVATPIGNLGDMSDRARRVLGEVAIIAAEDTRRTGKLLSAFSISTRMIAYHSHNEETVTSELVEMLLQGKSVALVSDAGTPLISDPGFPLIRASIISGIKVVPIPGPSSVAAAISVSGIPVHRFTFEGFIPARSRARRIFFESLVGEQRTMVFFEAPHRVRESLQDLAETMGAERQVTICRELTKVYEDVRSGKLADLIEEMAAGKIPAQGEFVLLVAGNPSTDQQLDSDRLLRELLSELPPTRAASLAARVTGKPRATLYQRALELKHHAWTKNNKASDPGI